MIPDHDPATQMVSRWFTQHGVSPRSLVALALTDGCGIGLAVDDPAGEAPVRLAVPAEQPTSLIATLTASFDPRWVWWDRETADTLVAGGVNIDRSWDIATVHHMMRGGGWSTVAEIWCDHVGLDPERAPRMGQMDLLGDEHLAATDAPVEDTDSPLLSSGYMRPDWVAGGWSDSPARLSEWAGLALEVALSQAIAIGRRDDAGRVVTSAHVESGAEFLCAELAAGGLPFDRDTAMSIIADAVGPDDESEVRRASRDAAVLELAPAGRPVDLRNPADVRELLRRVGLDLPDTRAHRLREHVEHHPIVGALLQWRKAERLGNTYGYRWLDEHVRDGRLRGQWSSSDGAAGRMTATAGLHNLPAELRPAVRADPGWVFVRADLGQVEPRVLAAVSGDDALIAATAEDDLYQTIATRLKVDRSVAKLAVLGAMYGSTTGQAAHALRSLDREYPAAMRYLERAADAGRRGESVQTVGGHPIHMWHTDTDGDIDAARRVAAARGRFARNAVVQGGAAELFKMWAVTVRVRARPHQASIVMCLHDELLVHVRAADADRMIAVVRDSLAEAAFRWSPRTETRFVADVSAVERWSETSA